MGLMIDPSYNFSTLSLLEIVLPCLKISFIILNGIMLTVAPVSI